MLQAVGILTVAAVFWAARRLHVSRFPRLGAERAQEGRGMKRAGADFDVVRLQDHAALLGPIVLQGKDQLLKVHAKVAVVVGRRLYLVDLAFAAFRPPASVGVDNPLTFLTIGKDLPYIPERFTMSETRLTSKGQITLPRDVRQRLKLKLGDRLRFRIADNGQVVLEAAKHHVAELHGLLQRKGRKPVSIEAMDDALRQRFKRS